MSRYLIFSSLKVDLIQVLLALSIHHKCPINFSFNGIIFIENSFPDILFQQSLLRFLKAKDRKYVEAIK